MSTRILSLLLALVLVGVPLAHADGERAFLWRVADGRSGVSLYLAGSVHVLRTTDLPLPAGYERAWQASEALMLEVDLTTESPAAIQQQALAMGRLSRDRRLDDVLSRRAYREFQRQARRLDLPISTLTPFEPWFAALTALSAQMSRLEFDQSLGVDRLYAERAVREGRAVTGLESLAEQLGSFDGLPMRLQERFLLDTLTDLERLPTALDDLIGNWRRGDDAALAKQQREGLQSVPEVYAALISRRHAAWLPRLEARLQSGPDTLVVVGAHHLVGPEALPTLLAAKGYQVERL